MKASELAKRAQHHTLGRLQQSLSTARDGGSLRLQADRANALFPASVSMKPWNTSSNHESSNSTDWLVVFEDLSQGITESDASYEKQRRDIDDPRFAVLKERTHIYNRPSKDG